MKNITIAGRIGRDAETRYTTSGQAVTDFSLAVDNRGKKKSEGPTWFKVTLWGEFGTKLADYLTKGVFVTVQGDFNLREYESNGSPRYSLEVTARDLTLGGGNSNGAVSNRSEQTEPAETTSTEITDEDIPF